ncbi:MAG: hypothetical protein JOZ42_03860 [Acetobacteraceae bacterium]|nr:hypothetical protein [Acetobacteraceae bacterium]
MAEDIAATPGWVEERLDEIWSAAGIADTPQTASARNTYLGCLATCGTGADDPERCQDLCRQAFVEDLRSARVPAEAIAGLESRLEQLEAEITDNTSPGPSK